MKDVLILFGGNSFEHDISCISVNFIINNIDEDLFRYRVVGITKNNIWYEVYSKDIDSDWSKGDVKLVTNVLEYLNNFDVVFPVIHGNDGEDGKIQSLLELLSIKYVGCSSYSSFVCYDKLLTKLILEKYNIPQVPYYIYSDKLDLNSIIYPVIVKPCKCGSSIGISKATNINELKKAISLALKYDSRVVIEKFIKNRELECAILESKKFIVSDVGEIINNGMWYDYDSKYINKSNSIISNIDNNIKEKIRNYSKKIFRILKCRGLSRVDFLYDTDNNKLYFNEINTMPGFTEISMYPKLISNEKISYKDLITFLINC